MISTEPTSVPTPNSVIRGSEPSSGLSGHIDWIRIRTPETRKLGQIRAILHRHFGVMLPTHSGNIYRARLHHGLTHENQVFLQFTETAPRLWTAQIDLTGDACSRHTNTALLELVTAVSRLCDVAPHATRLDCAMDLRGSAALSVESPADMIAFLIQNRDWQPKPFRKAGAMVEGQSSTCQLGTRQSNYLVRYYDKGIQMGTPEPWYRWESEFKAEKAQAALEHLLTIRDTNPDWVDEHVRYMATRHVEIEEFFPKLSNRLFTQHLDLHTPKPEMSPVEKWVDHSNRQYGRKIGLAAYAQGISPGQLAEDLGVFDLPPDIDLETAISDPRVVSIIESIHHARTESR